MRVSKNKKEKYNRFQGVSKALVPIDEETFPRTIETEKYFYNRFWVRPRAICYERWNKHFLLAFVIYTSNMVEIHETVIQGSTYDMWKEMEKKMEYFENNISLKVIAV